MKTITSILMCTFFIFYTSATAQKSSVTSDVLNNTSWAGVANVPSPQNVVFQFTKDEFSVYVGDELIEKMKYEMKDDQMIVNKISGGSPCTSTEKGVYATSITDDKLNMTLVSEECDARKQSNIGSSSFTKIED